MTEILVIGEHTDGYLSQVSRELLTAGCTLGNNISIALLGNNTSDAAADAIKYGADKVYLARNEELDRPSTDLKLSAYEQICRQKHPLLVLASRTQLGQDIGPRLAFRLGVGLAQDCLSVTIDPQTGRPLVTRPVHGGRIMAKVSFTGIGPNVVIIRKGAYDARVPADPNVGEIIDFPINIDPLSEKVHHIQTVASESRGVSLENASVIVAGGRGLGGPEPFTTTLADLAKLLGGNVGASRAACDAGWIDHNYQIGLTGKTVTPDLYITVGISGASQHMAGCSGARCIVAIDKDSEANIFQEASLGAVGDWKQILPSFIKTLEELLRS